MTMEKMARQTDNVERVPLVEYHVVPHGEHWHVERDYAFIGSVAYDVNGAIGLAISAAQRDQNEGNDVMVCVQESTGHCRKVWP
jgi:hypothetical protein